MPFKKFKILDYDFKLILMVVALAVIGIFAVGSAQGDLQSKQMYGVIAGFVVMIFASFIDIHFQLLRFVSCWLLFR